MTQKTIDNIQADILKGDTSAHGWAELARIAQQMIDVGSKLARLANEHLKIKEG